MPFKPALVAAIVVVSLAALGTGTAWGASTGITSGPSGTIATDSVVFTFDSPHDAGFECSFDGADWSSCTSPKSYSGLAEGPHVFEVRSLNRPGHPDPTPAARSFTVRTTIPDPPQTTNTPRPDEVVETPSAAFPFESSQEGSFEC